MGRNDFQVKIRGLRIELGEIEKLISKYPSVHSTVVTLKEFNSKDFLCAYVIADGRLSISNIKNYLSKKLPSYMIPTFIIQISNFPYTPNGKIDRKALPLPSNITTENSLIERASTPLEKTILKIWQSLLSISSISVTDNFFDIGGDSISALKMQIELLKIGIHVNYVDIFQNNNIRELATFIENDSSYSNTKLYHDDDFVDIHSLIMKNDVGFLDKPTRQKIGNVLLTGATGFLGIHILRELLISTNVKIYCLVRPDPSTSPVDKLLHKLHFYFGNQFDHLIDYRIFVMTADIVEPNLGLSIETITNLASQVSCVINSAALVKHYGDYKDFNNINVIGVQNLISFCENFNKLLIQISTTSVSGTLLTSLTDSYLPEEKVNFTERDLFIHQDLNNVYVRSKFEAERLILTELVHKRLKALILRVGNITNRYDDGKFQENDIENAFLNRLKAFLTLKQIPDSILDNYIEFTPVDFASKAIIKSIEFSEPAISILHIYNSKHLYINQLVHILKQLNIPIEIVDDSSFSTALKNFSFNNLSSDFNILLNDLDKSDKLLYHTNLTINNDFTIEFLQSIGFDWPEIDKSYIQKLLNNL